jgi:hypothetical protein
MRSVCQDGLDLILDFAIDDLRLWGWQGAAAKRFRGRKKWLEAINMKNIMNTHGGWKFDLKRDQ